MRGLVILCGSFLAIGSAAFALFGGPGLMVAGIVGALFGLGPAARDFMWSEWDMALDLDRVEQQQWERRNNAKKILAFSTLLGLALFMTLGGLYLFEAPRLIDW